MTSGPRTLAHLADALEAVAVRHAAIDQHHAAAATAAIAETNSAPFAGPYVPEGSADDGNSAGS